MDIACKYGLDVAVFVHNIVFWTEKNAANRNNFRDGRYWTHNSLDAFAALYPIWSKDQIKRIIAKCRDQGLLLTGAYNDNPYDRTKWYAPSDDLLRFYGIEITPDGIWRNRHIDGAEMHQSTYGEIAKCTNGENATCNKVQDNTQIIPPISPKGEKRDQHSKKAPKNTPKWKPERFEKFWSYYRENARKENRMGAVKAWDKLKPDDALIETMGRALQKQVSSPKWQDGIGIPYASTWLNNARWEDVLEADTSGKAGQRRYARTEIIDGREVDIYE